MERKVLGNGWREHGVLTEKQQLVRRAALAFHAKNDYIQYDQQKISDSARWDPLRVIDYRRDVYVYPEHASRERTLYFDCSSFIWSAYFTAFGDTFDAFVPKTWFMLKTCREAKENGEVTEDGAVVYYTDVTDEMRAQEGYDRKLVAELKAELIPGDVIVYSRNIPGRGYGGHTVLYLGDGYTIEAVGKDYSYVTGKDRCEFDGGLKLRVADENIFQFSNENGKYLFRFEDLAMIAIMRPLNNPKLTPTKRVLTYAENSCLGVEKYIVPEGMTVEKGEVLRVHILLKNTLALTEAKDITVTVRDELPRGAAFDGVSGGRVEAGEVIFENVKLPANGEIELSYSVAATGEECIVSGTGSANGIEFGYRDIEIGKKMTAEQLAALSEALTDGAAVDSALSYLSEIYGKVLGKTLGVLENETLFDTFFVEAEDDDEPKKTRLCMKAEKSRTGLLWRATVQPFIGGHFVMNATQEERAKRARYLKEESLLAGDLLAVKTKKGAYLYYVYLPNGVLARIADGESVRFLPEGSRTVDFGPEPDLEQDHTLDFPSKQEVLEGILAQERFVLLRLSKA